MKLLLLSLLGCSFCFLVSVRASAQSIYKVVNGKTVLKSSDERRSEEARRDDQRRKASYDASNERDRKLTQKADVPPVQAPALSREDRERLRKEEMIRKYEAEGALYRSSKVADRNRRCMSALRKAEYGLVDILTAHPAPMTAGELANETVRSVLKDLRLARILAHYYLNRTDSVKAMSEDILLTVDSSADILGSGLLDELYLRETARKWRLLLLAENPATARQATMFADREIEARHARGEEIKYSTPYYLLKAKALLTLNRHNQAGRLLDSFRAITTSLSFQPLEFEPRKSTYSDGMVEIESRVSYWFELRGLVYQKLGNKDSALACFRKAVVRAAPFSGAGPNYPYDNAFHHLLLPMVNHTLFDFNYPLRESFLGVAKLGGYQMHNENDTGFLCLRVAMQMNIPEAVALFHGRAWPDNPVPAKLPVKSGKSGAKKS